MNLFQKINYILNSKQKIRLVEMLILIVGGGFMELLGISIILPLVSVITDTSIIHTNQYYVLLYDLFRVKDDQQFIILLFIGVIIVYVLKNIYLLVMYDAQYRFVCNNQRRLATKLMDCYMKQTYLFHISKNISELQRNVSTDTAMFFQAVLFTLQLITECCVCLLLGLFLFLTDKTITMGVVLILGVFVWIFLNTIKRKSKILGAQTREMSSQESKWVRQSFEGIKEIKILNRENFFLKKFDDTCSLYMESVRKYQVINSAPKPIFETVCVAALLTVVAVKIARGVDLTYFIPVLSAFAVATFRLLPSFGRLTSYINSIIYNKVAIDAVYHDLKEVEQLVRDNKERYENQEILTMDKAIQIQNVSFRYPEVDKYVLQDVFLEIPKGKSVAFIGPSGAGKTTLADVILGILDPEDGRILVDDIDIRTNPNGWHRNLGYIPQNIYLMDDSIRNNILFGIPEEEADETKVWAALEDAQLKNFVESLSDGLDTVIGERGVRLSGGQRQRIGIARALYNNPEILVLDEATSALDNDTESAVMDAINHLSGKKTLIIIAHRLSTIENCDLIYEVRNGKVNLKNECN